MNAAPVPASAPPAPGPGGAARRFAAWLHVRLGRRLERSIRPADSTRLRIQREMALMTRGRPPFALVVFDVGGWRSDPRPVRALIRALRGLARAGDEIGWLDERHVAVMLPATAQSNGLAFAAAVQKALLPARQAPVPFVVRTGAVHERSAATFPWSSAPRPGC